MKNKVLAVLSTSIALLLLSGPMFAHHSDSVYDHDRFVTIKGTVTKYEFVNPHVLIHLAAKDDKGSSVTWTTLGGPPNRMAKGAGWTGRTFKDGEELTIIGFPFRDDRPVMLFQLICRSNGEAVPMSETVTAFSRRQGKVLSCADAAKEK